MNELERARYDDENIWTTLLARHYYYKNLILKKISSSHNESLMEVKFLISKGNS